MLHIRFSISTDIDPLIIHLPPMFAIYNLTKRRGNQEFIGLSSLYFSSLVKGKTLKIPLNEIAKVLIEQRRKLGPLVVGGIITSLGMLSILLYSSSMEVVAIVAAGLLLTYYGMQEYLVIHIEHGSNTQLIWLPGRVSLKSIRPLIGILEYYVAKHQFPVLFALSSTKSATPIIHSESHSMKSTEHILYSFANHQTSGNQPIAVSPQLLDAPIIIYGEDKFIGKSDYLINNNALIENNTVSYS